MENIKVQFPKTTEQSKLNEETKLLLEEANLFVNQENIPDNPISFIALSGTYKPNEKEIYLLGVLVNRTHEVFKNMSFEIGIIIKDKFKSDVISLDFPNEFLGDLPRNYGILTGFHIGITLPEKDLVIPSSEITTYGILPFLKKISETCIIAIQSKKIYPTKNFIPVTFRPVLIAKAS